MRDKRLEKHLGKYFDEIIAHIRDAELIQIFGPGEAKSELAKRLEVGGLKARIVEMETMDKMTDNQIAAKVREYFTTYSLPGK